MRRVVLLIATSVALILSQTGASEARRHHGSHHSRHTHRVHVPVVSHRSVLPVLPEQSAFEKPQEAVAYKDLDTFALMQGWYDVRKLVIKLGLTPKRKKEKVEPMRPLGVAFSMLGVVLLGTGICIGLDRRMKREKYESGAYKS